MKRAEQIRNNIMRNDMRNDMRNGIGREMQREIGELSTWIVKRWRSKCAVCGSR